jgi:site-specific DNA-methyltransferase (adenine-specific)
MKPFGEGAGHKFVSTQTGDADGMEEVLIYECEDGCPVKLLDAQSGVSVSTGGRTLNITPSKVYGGGKGLGSSATVLPEEVRGDPGFGDKGGASRFFGQIQPDAPFLYSAKVSRSERNKGLVAEGFQEGFVMLREDLSYNEREKLDSEWPEELPDPESVQREDLIPSGLKSFFEPVKPGTNPHPTVKPLALMEWCVRLVTPKGSTVLDPYCGSGTTCMAALGSDCNYIGIEKDPLFHNIATKRIEAMRPDLEQKAERRSQQALVDMMSALDQE